MGLKKLLYSIIIINIRKNASVVRKRVSGFQKNFLKYTGNEARTAGKGTGLGLSIAKQIVKMHGGEMTLVAAPRKPYQTAFCIQIPTVK